MGTQRNAISPQWGKYGANSQRKSEIAREKKERWKEVASVLSFLVPIPAPFPEEPD